MTWRCILFFHNWNPVAVRNYLDTSYRKEGEGTPSTMVTLQCMRCGKLKPQILFGSGGNLNLHDLHAKSDNATSGSEPKS